MDGIDHILKSKSRRENGAEMNLTFMDGKAIYTITEETANEHGLRRSDGFVNEAGFEGDKITDANLKNPDLDVGRTWIELSKTLYALSQKNVTPEIETKPFDPSLPPGPDNVYSPLANTKPIKIDENSLVAQKLKPPETDKEFAEWGLNHIGHLEYNLTSLGVKALEVGLSDDPNLALALYQMFSMYDELPMFTKEGTARAIAGMATDPFAYIGIATLGASTVGKQILGGLTKAGLKKGLAQTIKKNFGNDILLAVEGGLYAGSYDAFRQTFGLKSGEQKEYNVGSTVTMAGTGAVLAPAIGRGVNLAGRGIAAGAGKARQMISDRAARAKAGRQGTTTLRSGPNPDDVVIALDNVLPKKKLVDQDELGFYSKALEAAKELKQEKGTGEQFKAMLTSNKVGVKKDEIFWTGLDEVLSKNKVTKQEIVDHLEQNRVEIEERLLEGSSEETDLFFNIDENDNSVYGDNTYAYGGGKKIDITEPEYEADLENYLAEARDQLESEKGDFSNLDAEEFTDEDVMERALENYEREPFVYWVDDQTGLIIFTEPGGGTFSIRDPGKNPNLIDTHYKNTVDLGRNMRIDSIEEAQIQAKQYAIDQGYIDEYLDETRYEQFVQPGGENYKEILLTLPGFKGDPFLNDLQTSLDNKYKRRLELINSYNLTVENPDAKIGSAQFSYFPNNPEIKEITQQIDELTDQINAAKKDTSDHHDEGNVLAHMLVKDRFAEDGGKVLFAEEIQSDWSQAGQGRKGDAKFMSKETQNELLKIEQLKKEFLDTENSLADAIKEGYLKISIIDLEEEFGKDTPEFNRELQRLKANTDNLSEVGNWIRFLQRSERDFSQDSWWNRIDIPLKRKIEDLKILTNEKATTYNKARGTKIIPRGPFVDTSDKFTTLALKRLMRYAVDNGYDYVSWATGDVIANRYNKPGLAQVYDKNIPNLSNELLKKLDKGQKVVPIKIDMFREGIQGVTADTNVFVDHLAIPITENLKTSVKAGQPLFTVGAGGAGVVAATQGENDGR